MGKMAAPRFYDLSGRKRLKRFTLMTAGERGSAEEAHTLRGYTRMQVLITGDYMA